MATTYSPTSDVLQDMVYIEQLVKKLYQPGSPQDVAHTEKALQGLQRSQQGWQLADSLLHSQDPNVRFFGALTFTIKINQDWDSLTEADGHALLYLLVDWLIKLVGARESALVLKKLCSALIAYFLRPSGFWKFSIRHLLLSFTEGHAIPLDFWTELPQTTNAVSDALTGTQLQVVLWFASGLVEEVNKADSASIQSYRYYERVSINVAEIVDLLHYSMQGSGRGDLQTAEQGVKCFQSWVMYAQRGWVDKGSELESLRPITPLAMSMFRHPELYDAVTGLFADILNHFPAFLTPNDFHQLSVFLTSEDSQYIVAKLKAGDFDEDCMAFAELMLAYGDAAIQDLATQPHHPQLNQIMSQLLDLLRCNEAGGTEYHIYSVALEFWMTYTEFAIDSLFDEDAEKPTTAWMTVAKQRIEALIEAAWEKIQMPPPNIAATWDSEAKVSWHNFRKDVQDMLQSSFTLLGVDLVEKLTQLALRGLNDRAWLPLEATLFCLNALSDSVADEDTVDEILIRIFESSLFVDMTNNDKSIPGKTRKTAVIMISNFTTFFERHPEHLPSMLNFLFVSLNIPSLADVAAKAILSTCSSCRMALTAELDTFLQQYMVLSSWNSLEIDTKEKVAGAIASIIQALPTEEDKVAPLTQLIKSIETDANYCVRALHEAPNDEVQTGRGLGALKCLASIGKGLQAPDDVVVDLDADESGSIFWTHGQGALLQGKVVTMLQVFIQLMSHNSDAVDAGCRILRAGYKERTPGLFVFPIEVTINLVLTTNLATARLDLVLETAGVMLASRPRDRGELTMPAAILFLGHMLTLIAAMNFDPSFDPEASVGIIELVNVMAPRYLYSLEHTRDIEFLFNFFLASLTVPEIMPKRSAAQFWANFVQRHDLPEQTSRLIHSVMQRFGPPVCQVLVHRIAGVANRSELDMLAEPLKKIIFSQQSAKVWLSDALSSDDFPSQKVGQAEKRVWLAKIMGLRGTKATNAAVRDFWVQCRGSEFSYTS